MNTNKLTKDKPLARKLGKGYTYMLAFMIVFSFFNAHYEFRVSINQTGRDIDLVPKVSTPYESLFVLAPHLCMLILVLGGDTDKLAYLIGRMLLKDKT